MSTLASSLLDFILDLFRDPEKAAAYEEDPQGTLDAAGLTDLTPDDVADLMPMVADYSTVGGWSGGRGDSCDGDEGGRPSGVRSAHDRDEDEDRSSWGGGSRPDEDEDDDEDDQSSDNGHHGGSHETVVITHLKEIQYENHETHVSIDASHSIWVSGDAQAIFGDDNVFVGGDGVAAGGDVEDVANNTGDGVAVRGDVEESEIEVENSHTENEIGGDGLIGDGNHGAEIGNSETDVDLEDVNVNAGDGTLVDDSENVGNAANSFNEDTAIADRGGQVGDDVDVDLDDSFNDNSDNSTEVDVTDSFNDESVDVEDNELAFGGENANTGAQGDVDLSEYEPEFTNEGEISVAADESFATTAPAEIED
jgi:hypothetical protein